MLKLFVSFFLVQITLLMAVEPLAVYLTCQKSPDTAMTVQWITSLQDERGTIHYKKCNDEKWQKLDSSFFPLPNKNPHGVHRIEMQSLEPNSEYVFRIGEEEKEYKFRTLPDKLLEPLTFINGGDIYGKDMQHYEEMNCLAANQNPHFILWGGDLAYAANRYFLSLEKSSRWLELLSIWSKTMITSDDHLIPLIVAIGNHEVTGRYSQVPAKAPFFYTLFPSTGYQAVDVGDYLSLILLDSGHTHPIEGLQTDWLRSTLTERQSIPFKFACYHVPAFPCVRSYKNKYSTKVRKYWPPLFEEFKVLAAFEHHDHAYKRTHLISSGNISQKGVLYLGDGGWAVECRKPRSPSKCWYIAKSDSKRHFIHVTIYPDKKVRYKAIDPSGAIFDEYIQSAL